MLSQRVVAVKGVLMTQAVVKRGEQEQLEDINQQLQEWKQKGCHLLSPLTLQMIPPMHRVVVTAVEIDPNPVHKEVYPQKGGGLSLSAISFKKLLDAMGVRWNVAQCGRTDDGSNPNLIRYRMVGQIKGFDGVWHDIFGEKEISLDTVVEELTDNYRQKAIDYEKDPKDGPAFKQRFPTTDAVDGWIREKVRQDALQIKKHMLARAQTGAMARACKSRGLRETYTLEELKRPFVFPSLVPELDVNNEGDRDFLRRQAMGATDLLYPTAPASAKPDSPRPAVTVSTGDLNIIDVPAQPDSFTTTSEPAQSTDPTPAESLRADFLACDPKGQTEVLQKLMKRKAYTGKIQGELSKWTAQDRTAFFDRLVQLPDASGAPSALPFE